MKAISLWEPWATLVVLQEKKIETRSWSTPYRGPLAIHAAKHWTKDIGRMCLTDPFAKPLLANGFCGITRPGSQFRFGMIIGTCELTDVALIYGGGTKGVLSNGTVVKSPEFDFGDYGPGRYAWILNNVVKLDRPLFFRGRQGFFNVPDEMLDRCQRAETGGAA